MVKLEDIIYWAGLFDGEGYVGIGKARDKTRLRGFGFNLTVQIKITYLPILLEGQRMFGGSIRKTKKYSDAHKDRYVWILCCKQASHFLELILPYLREKKLQAEVALLFQSQRKQHKGLSDGEFYLQDSCFEILKMLKHLDTSIGGYYGR